MDPTDLRVALFSGNYNYVRDGANQAQNMLVDYLLRQGVAVRVYSPTVAKPAFAPRGDLVDASSPACSRARGREASMTTSATSSNPASPTARWLNCVV